MKQQPANSLPAPSADALQASARLSALIRDDIARAGGAIGFDRFMQHALYAPQWGYYTGGAVKFAGGGDFTTAPQMTPLFGHAIARQVGEVLQREGLSEVLEFGAGTGQLADDVLRALRAQGLAPRYGILDLSGELRARQQATLAAQAPDCVAQVHWLDALPARFEGVVLANELLDAMPVRVVRKAAHGWVERVVVAVGEQFAWADGAPCDGPAVDWAAQLPDGYVTETQAQAQGYLRSLGGWLARGVALFIDYGFPEAEFYHPQRSAGTLMAHYRHRAHDDLLRWPGLQDITAHVDFTGAALAAQGSGLAVLGYTTQAHFLLNCGVLDALQQIAPERERLRHTAAVQRLLAESEMGELFKVLALGRGVGTALSGFARGDRTHRL